MVVIGGGYTAMDCSRTSLRHGAENVAIVYRPHALRARRRRGGAGRDGARGRAHGVPRQPDRGARRGRPRDRREVHPQQARRARRVRSPLARADPRLGVRDQGGHRHPGRVAGGGPDVPPGRGELRGQPRPGQGRSRDLCDERARRLRLRRLRDRPDDAHRGGRPRQEVRLRDRPLPLRADGRDGRRQRQDHELVAPRHAGVLRRPAPPAHPDDRAPRRGCPRPIRTSTSRPRSSWATTPPRPSPSRPAA